MGARRVLVWVEPGTWQACLEAAADLVPPAAGAEVHLPFGGMKQTGNGHREAGQAALDVFTEWKSVYVVYSGRLQRAQIDNQQHPAPQ